MVGMLIVGSYSIVDTIFIGWSAGELGLASVAVTWPLVMMFGAVGDMLGTGAAIIIAQSRGSGNLRLARLSLGNMLVWQVLFSLLMMTVVNCFLTDILRLFGATDELMPGAVRYSRILIYGNLAYMLVKDGEGASKVARIHVAGAASDADAERVARTVGHSQLVKTALYGRDANWGRIVAAVGRSGADFNPDDVVVTLCGVELFRKGQPTDLDFDALLEEPLKQRDLPIDIVLGSGSYTLLASDLGHEYVNVNADYRS